MVSQMIFICLSDDSDSNINLTIRHAICADNCLILFVQLEDTIELLLCHWLCFVNDH